MKKNLIYAAWLGLASLVQGEDFRVTSVPNPPGVDPQIGGMAVADDGRVFAAFHRGEVMVFDPKEGIWTRFAEGLHEPLGLILEKDGSVLVMQRAELTRLRDKDGDGRAEEYETVFDDFGMSGNYHEFAFGPARGPDGWLYVGLNVASNGAGIREEIRGEWSEIGDLNFEEMIHGPDFGKRRGKAGRMYARVPWRGWILRISPDGSVMEPFASGFRSPDGLGFDAEGRLLMTDNQGDWRGTSPLYHVKAGGFYGHPSSLVWREGWDRGDPLKLPVAELEKMRVAETARFPQGDLANSPTEPVVIPDSWGQFGGQVLIGEMNQPRMVRFMADEVDGFLQGTLVSMFEETNLGRGNHRLAFAKDGTLWVGKTHLSWAGAEGLVKIEVPKVQDIFAVKGVKLEKVGDQHRFWVELTHSAAEVSGVKMKHFDYHYHQAYGSPKVNEAEIELTEVRLEDEGRLLLLTGKFEEGAIHEIDLRSLGSEDGKKLEGQILYYQASRLPKE